ncbi:MAG: hypothetical protein GY859_23290 [Desulfobacterales bacterium]|nr:hypothetical protein [Desulfobacterales bacterium]
MVIKTPIRKGRERDAPGAIDSDGETPPGGDSHALDGVQDADSERKEARRPRSH